MEPLYAGAKVRDVVLTPDAPFNVKLTGAAVFLGLVVCVGASSPKQCHPHAFIRIRMEDFSQLIEGNGRVESGHVLLALASFRGTRSALF